jgi:ornithine cyclodeaminase
LPSELALVVLMDPDTGATRAMIDGTGITEMRTGALTALGAQYLARPDSAVLGHVGARGTSWWNVVYLDAQFNFSEIRVTSRRSSSREEFAERLQDYLQKPVVAVDTVEKCLRGADIMVEATRLSEPQVLLHTAWVTPGTFLVPYGTVSAVDIDLLDVIDKVVVDDWGQATEGPFGALRRHIDEGRLTAETLHAELADIVIGKRPGRETADERILFWHRGLSTTDVAVAQMIFERAEAANLGTVLTLH